MTAVLIEELGPRGRQRVRIATVISLVVLLALGAWIIRRVAATGNFDPALWEEFVDFDFGWPQFLLTGLVNTARAAAAAMVFATTIGFVMALGRLARNRVTRWAARTYVELFRTIPVVLFIFFAYFGLQELGVGWITALWGVVLGLTAYNSAVLAEIFRAGILSLDKGQSEAASAVGLTYWQSMALVILPQAVRRMTPAIVAQLATLTKDVSLGFLIGYEEVVRRGRVVGESSPSNNLQAYFVVGVIYFIVIYLLARLARRLEVRQRRRYGAGKMVAGTGMEDIEVLGEEADAEEITEGTREAAVSG
ncbi:MAG TPA: amino acid ABC transporter permease [Euzebyales bacterium]|nr:amino acid ABC transporter permease [Euzebyales bacterium]